MPLSLGPPSPFHAMICFTWLAFDDDLYECDLMRLIILVDGSCTPYEFHTWAASFMRRPIATDDRPPDCIAWSVILPSSWMDRSMIHGGAAYERRGCGRR